MPAFKKATIAILDRKFKKNYLKNLADYDIVFRSPGIPYRTPQLFRARCRGLKVSSATILFFENSPTAHIIGITGSKGKGTTATLLYKIMKAAGKDVHLAGNIGVPALRILPRLKKNSWVILELSSFQLQDLPYSPPIAVVLDTFPEHLDHHKSIREYYGSKSNIARFQKVSDKVLYFGDNQESARIAEKGRGRRIPVLPKTFGLFSGHDLAMRGAHNFRNAVMAATAARHVGVPEKTIMRVIKNFRGIEHRLELVREISTHNKSGMNTRISFYNDSASTNPHTAAAAVRAFYAEPHILIAGGQDKKLNYAPLARALNTSSTKLVVLLGENKHKIARAIRAAHVPVKFAKTIHEAVVIAYHVFRSRTLTPRSSIIFSPGAASFDMFENYADRGAQFKTLVKNLIRSKN